AGPGPLPLATRARGAAARGPARRRRPRTPKRDAPGLAPSTEVLGEGLPIRARWTARLCVVPDEESNRRAQRAGVRNRAHAGRPHATRVDDVAGLRQRSRSTRR